MSGKNWILLVAGSKGWANYKHQANVCGFYQIIKKHGIPDEQIVVMMYDDIAHNPKNPRNNPKGDILSVVDDSNVYSGVPKDFTGKDVTPENFLAALKGKKGMNKKVIESGPNDNIFVYMCGLGQEGAFQFPEKALYPKDLIGTIKGMHDESKFSKMMIFMESDYSGSMFEDLPKNIDVYAMTSCHKHIATTHSDYDEQRKVYLSDRFSSAWLKYLNTADFTEETFHHLIRTKQSKYLQENREKTCQFGDMKIANRHLHEFLQK